MREAYLISKTSLLRAKLKLKVVKMSDYVEYKELMKELSLYR